MAVLRSQSGLYVFLLRPDSTVAVQTVEIGQDDGRTAEITSGLADGAQVTVNGMSRLQDGSVVAVAGAKPPAPAQDR